MKVRTINVIWRKAPLPGLEPLSYSVTTRNAKVTKQAAARAELGKALVLLHLALQELRPYPVLGAVIGARVDRARRLVAAADPAIVSVVDVVTVPEVVLVPVQNPGLGNSRDWDWQQQLLPLLLAMPDQGTTSRRRRKTIVVAGQEPVAMALTSSQMTLEIPHTETRRLLKLGWPEQPSLDWSNELAANLETVEASPARRAGSEQGCLSLLQA